MAVQGLGDIGGSLQSIAKMGYQEKQAVYMDSVADQVVSFKAGLTEEGYDKAVVEIRTAKFMNKFNLSAGDRTKINNIFSPEAIKKQDVNDGSYTLIDNPNTGQKEFIHNAEATLLFTGKKLVKAGDPDMFALQLELGKATNPEDKAAIMQQYESTLKSKVSKIEAQKEEARILDIETKKLTKANKDITYQNGKRELTITNMSFDVSNEMSNITSQVYRDVRLQKMSMIDAEGKISEVLENKLALYPEPYRAAIRDNFLKTTRTANEFVEQVAPKAVLEDKVAMEQGHKKLFEYMTFNSAEDSVKKIGVWSEIFKDSQALVSLLDKLGRTQSGSKVMDQASVGLLNAMKTSIDPSLDRADKAYRTGLFKQANEVTFTEVTTDWQSTGQLEKLELILSIADGKKGATTEGYRSTYTSYRNYIHADTTKVDTKGMAEDLKQFLSMAENNNLQLGQKNLAEIQSAIIILEKD